MAVLSPQQIYDYARGAGFPHATAVKMVAIALKESSGQNDAYNGVGRDQSYGLWQINMIGAIGPERRAQLGLASNQQLFDPATNARAAYMLWAGDDRNLDRHWAIERSATDRTRYNQYLAQIANLFPSLPA